MTVLEKIRELRRQWDRERVTRPDLYGDPPKAVWKRLRRPLHRQGKVTQHDPDTTPDQGWEGAAET